MRFSVQNFAAWITSICLISQALCYPSHGMFFLLVVLPIIIFVLTLSSPREDQPNDAVFLWLLRFTTRTFVISFVSLVAVIIAAKLFPPVANIVFFFQTGHY
ncbi:MAG: hypothetical protein AAF483_24020 [Planctomycetota bacterium]